MLRQPLHDAFDHAGVPGVLQKDQELVPAITGRRVRFTHMGADAVGDLDEKLVAEEMAHGVVDALEVVEVHPQDGVGVVGLPSGRQHGLGQPVKEQLPVGQPGQVVVERLTAQLLLQ